jgi:CRISPR-associated endonuclease Cas2
MTVAIYDISNHQIRKVAEVHMDYGFGHIQYSVFSGPLDAPGAKPFAFKW